MTRIAPGLDGYIAAQEEARRREAGQLQNMGAALTLAQIVKQRENEQALQSEMAKLGPNPSTEAMLGVAAKYGGDPMKVIELHLASKAREDAAKDRALQFAQKNALDQRQLDLAREQFNQRTSDAKARQEFDEYYKRESLRLRERSDALDAQLRQQGLEVTRQGQQLQIQRADDVRERRLQDQVQGLSKRGDDLANLFSGIAEVNAVLAPYVTQGKSIPGLGYGTNVEVLGMDVSGPFIGEEGKKVRSAVKNVANKILKAEAGAAVTLPEEVRQNLALMSTGQFSERDFLNAWPRVVAAMQANLDNIAAGYDPQAIQLYRQRGGSLPFGQKLSVPQPPQASPGGEVPPPPPGFKLLTP